MINDNLFGLLKKKLNINEGSLKNLVRVLENGDRDELAQILYQPLSGKIEFLPITFDMLLKLKKPPGAETSLSIYKIVLGKHCSMLIFDVSWSESDIKYSPAIIHNSTCKILGIMLPFNELDGKFTKKEYEEAINLGMGWTGFAMSIRLGI